ncbi:RES domain protein [Rubripirellula obstinata]|uniref:RES domain protein n=3 Tax=Rubripirellula obstinata TaxID=406547 RepID=A0A5B1CEE2_9BACT|nr:RES family NAD+ phosphorylase [Rubripirellula obstinata]KAA1258946.1 RES domain protein [Rubripirellula obstinata]
MSYDFGFCCFGRFESGLRSNNEHIFDLHTTSFLDAVGKSAEQFSRQLEIDVPLHRAQHGCDYVGPDGVLVNCFNTERMLPNDRVGDGRANKKGKPVFYGATLEKLAIQETRPWIGQHVSVAVYQLERPRRILDLTSPAFVPVTEVLHRSFGKGQSPVESVEYERAAWSDIAGAFATPVTRGDDPRDYLATQVLTELFRSQGFEGLAFRSSLNQCDADLDKVGYNVVLFDYENLLETSSKVVEILQLDLRYKSTLA